MAKKVHLARVIAGPHNRWPLLTECGRHYAILGRELETAGRLDEVLEGRATATVTCQQCLSILVAYVERDVYA